MYKLFGKRLMDILLSLSALLLFGVPMLVVALCLKVTIGSPVIFKQERNGKHGRIFSLYKFRTMTNETDEKGVYLPDAQRMTRLGRILRETSIDELPSLINILKGEMSVIGPRPLPIRYMERYTDTQRRRHEALPGLSCMDAVSGRNLMSWDEKFALDVWYVDHISLALDISIILQTVAAILTKNGTVASDGDVRSEFWGILPPGSVKDSKYYVKM